MIIGSAGKSLPGAANPIIPSSCQILTIISMNGAF